MSASPNIFLIIYIYQLIFISFTNNTIEPIHSSFSHSKNYRSICSLIGEFKFNYKFLSMILQEVISHNLSLINRVLKNRMDFSKCSLDTTQILYCIRVYTKKTLSNLKRLK